MVVRTKLESGNVSIYMHVRRVNFRSYGALSDDAHNQQCETSHCLRRERCVRAVAFESSSVRSTLLLHTTVAREMQDCLVAACGRAVARRFAEFPRGATEGVGRERVGRGAGLSCSGFVVRTAVGSRIVDTS